VRLAGGFVAAVVGEGELLVVAGERVVVLGACVGFGCFDRGMPRFGIPLVSDKKFRINIRMIVQQNLASQLVVFRRTNHGIIIFDDFSADEGAVFEVFVEIRSSY